MNPYTADMARLAVKRMTLKAEICRGNACATDVPRFQRHWEALATDYRRAASQWQAELNRLTGLECA